MGVVVEWRELPGFDFELGVEEQYGSNGDVVRTFLIRRGEGVTRIPDGEGTTEADRVNFYRTRDGKLAVIVRGQPRVFDVARGRLEAVDNIDTDLWVYQLAFDFVQIRTSRGNLDGQRQFIDNQTQHECIPAVEGDVLHRVFAQSQHCEAPVWPSAELRSSAALARSLSDYLLEGARNPDLPGIVVLRRIAPDLVGVEQSREFWFVDATSRDEARVTPPDRALLVVKVIGEGEAVRAEVVQRYAWIGTPELWIIDAGSNDITVFAEPRDGVYLRTENIGMRPARTPRVPGLSLSLWSDAVAPE